MTIKNAKQCLREEVIPTLRERSSYFDVASIKHLLTERGVHVDRDLMARVFDFFRDARYNAYLNPTRREAQKSFSVGEKTVVVRPNVTKAPVDGHLARIEKILVDLRVELESLLLMDVGEFQEMSQRAVTSQRIEISSLMSYAKRRRLDWKGLFQYPDSIISTIAQ